MNNIGFIGVGYMGYGIAKNILDKGNNLFVIANKNRKPIEKIVSKGAIEVSTLEEFKEKIKAAIQCKNLYTALTNWNDHLVENQIYLFIKQINKI